MKQLRSAGWYMLFTAPLLCIFATVVLIPFVTGLGYAFFSWDGLPLNPKIFVGLSNFGRLGEDHRFLASAGYTIVFTILSIITINVLGLAFALVVTTRLKVRNAARTMLFAPYMIGGLILGYVWKFILGEAFK
ncbi:MAG: sugar ABC transporter permease, partial [Spirochaetaceae bacterium]|nr:sugar ABC transporter permease [Spirochaetaceae bacterium]